jgi:hypothetical protein
MRRILNALPGIPGKTGAHVRGRQRLQGLQNPGTPGERG